MYRLVVMGARASGTIGRGLIHHEFSIEAFGTNHRGSIYQSLTNMSVEALGTNSQGSIR